MEANSSCGPSFRRIAIAASLLMSTLAGCSERSTPTAAVSGKVTLDGKPLANVSVLFQPVGSNRDPGVGSYGITDAQGGFTLKQSGSGRDGAVVGQHAVTLVEKTDPANDDDAGGIDKPVVSRIPAEYSNGSLRFEVKSGTTNRANFDLKSASN
jgi:hypothetical protein